MRLKQLLGIVLLLLVLSCMAAAGEARLTNVSVASQGSGTSVTLHATGNFTHNEYRPSESLLLVDLKGVSAGNLNERARTLQVPGVKGYRVVGYKGAGGTDVTRVEFTLEPDAKVQVSPMAGGVVVNVTGATMSASAVERSAWVLTK